VCEHGSVCISRGSCYTSISAKSSHLDFIPTSLIKDLHFAFSDIIARLANLSFTGGVFPDSYKSAVVTPIFKKPNLDRDDPANYLPISNLNNISKFLERLFLTRFQSHVCASDNFSSVQSAYRCHYSTETGLLHTMDSVFRSSDQGQPSLLVSFYTSAAFDTIDHSILLNRLQVGFGVSGSALTWLQSYLTDRYQCVRVGQASSSPTFCHTGVPQGSVLGPILFSCYTSPISFIADTFGVSIQQYADDTQLYVSLNTTDIHARQSLLSDLLSALHSRFCHNGLSSIAVNLNLF